MTPKTKLTDLACVIRSKNASPYELTIDVIFDDDARYQRVKDSNVLTAELIAELYRIPKERIVSLGFFDPGRAFKVTVLRDVCSGSIGDRDVFGAQQHAPMLDIVIEPRSS